MAHSHDVPVVEPLSDESQGPISIHSKVVNVSFVETNKLVTALCTVCSLATTAWRDIQPGETSTLKREDQTRLPTNN